MDINNIKSSIAHEVFHITDPRMDGFTTFARKQKLIELQMYLEEQLAKCPTYAGEKEFIQDLKTQRAFKDLAK